MIVDEYAIVAEMPRTPNREGANDRPQLGAFRRQCVLRSGRMIRIHTPDRDPLILEHFETIGQHARCNTLERSKEVLELLRSGEEVADDQERPAFAQEFERFGDGAALSVLLRHAFSIALDVYFSSDYYFRT